MNRKFILILSLTAVLAFIGCSDSTSHKESAGTSERGMLQTETTLRLVIRWPGDDLASRQDIETRNKIQNVISEKKLGKIISVGTGMGWMDIVVEVQDKQAARSKIDEIVRRIAPERKFTIE